MRSARPSLAGSAPTPGSPLSKEADMSLPKLIAATVLVSTIGFAAAQSAQPDTTPAVSASGSKVRIVRLCEVKGDVMMDRAIGRGMEKANANLPIVEQSKIETGDGAAEIELEDNSSLRLGPGALVEFPKLERLPNGTTVSWARVVRGTAYLSLLKSNNQFTLLFGEQKIDMPAPSHVRLEIAGGAAKMAVLDGTLQVQGPSGNVAVAKKRTVTFNLATAGEMNVASGVSSEPLDDWDKEAAGYHSRVAMASTLNSSPYSYGLNDMSYYGSFMDASSCGAGIGAGMMWRPYFASAAWSPYSNGSWAWYGSGYSWVSPYPWGWTPYHYGSWNFCPGMGWGWMPGGNWMGLDNTVMMPPAAAGNGPGGAPLRPFQPPAKGAATVIPVNGRPLVRSEIASPDSFVFRRDSAGLGVPRDQLGKLDHFSQHAMTHGTASTEIFISTPRMSGGPTIGRGFNTQMLGSRVNRGSPPMPTESMYESGRAAGGAGGSNASSASSSSSSMPRASGGPSTSGGGRPR